MGHVTVHNYAQNRAKRIQLAEPLFNDLLFENV